MKYDEHFIEYCQRLGKHIQKLREEKNMTIDEISNKTGIRGEYIRKIEQGTAYGVKLENHLLIISNVLNIKLSDLFDF